MILGKPNVFLDMTEPARQVQGFGRGTGARAEEGEGSPAQGLNIGQYQPGEMQDMLGWLQQSSRTLTSRPGRTGGANKEPR